MTGTARLSYSHGASPDPLLGETIGENLRRTAARHPDREALVDVPSGRRWTYAAARRRRRHAGPGAARRGRRGRRPGRHLVPELRRVGAAAVRDRADRARPRQHQPGLPQPRARLRAAPVGRPDAGQRRVVQDERLPGDGRRGPRRPGRAASGSSTSAPTSGTRCSRPGAAHGGCAEPTAGRARGGAGLRRPDQHPVHLRDHRLPQGRDALPPQHPQQRLLRRRGLPLHRGRPGLHPGALLPLLRHGDGQPGLHHARRLHRHPGARLRPGRRRSRRSRPSAARRSTACRPCSSPSSPCPTSPATTCPRCAPGSWPARRARSR